jgi:xanthine dehydrogenase accessory factor
MINEAMDEFLDAVRRRKSAALVTVLTGSHAGERICLRGDGTRVGGASDPALDALLMSAAQAALDARQSQRTQVAFGDSTLDLFADVTLPPERLIIVGAVHTAIALVTLANAIGLHTTVIDNRTAFATRERFAHAHELLTRWPADVLAELALDESSFVVFLTHDEKIDNPALAVALNSPALYVGALGSRKTHDERVASLRESGVSEVSLNRIRAPIGLNIGARTPEEIALSILAEIVAVRNGSTTAQVLKP